jgi:hypothetical protein
MIKAALILAGALAALPAIATPITFTISQEAVSVDLNGTIAMDELVTFTQTTDTSLITDTCDGTFEGYPCTPAVTTNTVTIEGIGTETLTGGSYFFDNSINLFGITGAPGSAFLAAESAPPFDTYAMTTAFGPTAYSFYPSSSVVDVATNNGPLTIAWNTDDQPTAQACLASTCSSPSSSGVPEPATWLLAGAGFAALIARRFTSLRSRSSTIS